MKATELAEPSRVGDTTERDLVRWSWAVGGWAGVHAALAIIALAMGMQLNVTTFVGRVLALIMVAAWATASIGAWRFRQSFRLSMGFLASGASLMAGITLPIVGAAASGAVVDGVAHGLAGVGFAAALWRARSRFEDRELRAGRSESQLPGGRTSGCS